MAKGLKAKRDQFQPPQQAYQGCSSGCGKQVGRSRRDAVGSKEKMWKKRAEGLSEDRTDRGRNQWGFEKTEPVYLQKKIRKGEKVG